MIKTFSKYLLIFILWVTVIPLLSAQERTTQSVEQDSSKIKLTPDTTKLKAGQDTTKLKAAKDSSHVKADTIFHRFCFQEQFDDLSKISFTTIDTSLNAFQRYEPLTGCAFLGNSGKAYKSLSFELDYKPGFDLGENAYHAYMPAYDEVKYFNVNTPYSELYFVMGGSKEQILKVTHTQNVNKRLNVALNFNIINSLGAYRRQKTDITNLVVSTNYRSPGNRYIIIGNVITNKWYNYENGGLLDITQFTSELLTRPDLFDLNLNNAQNRVKERGVFLKQYLNFNKKTSDDTLNHKDSTLFNTRLIHTLHYERTTLMYIDGSPAYPFYPVMNFDSKYTGDSMAVKVLSNEIKLLQIFARNRKNKPVIYAEAGLEHQYIDHRQFITYFIDLLHPVKEEMTFINQYIPRFNLYFNPSDNLTSRFGGYMIKQGYNNGDLGFNAMGKFNLNTTDYFTLTASVDHYQPAFNYSYYISNHYIWDYSFDKTNSIRLKTLLNLKGYKAEIEINQLSNYVYFDFFARPKQFENAIQVASASISKLFKFGIFSINNKILVQQSSNKTIMPMPWLVNNHSFYVSGHLFKKALYAQTGLDVYYNTAFYGYNYMPATRQFYLQTTTLTGNYPLIDAFINLQIKRANIFAKLTHLNQGFSGHNYYSIPDYPLQGRAFKVGISWKFYD